MNNPEHVEDSRIRTHDLLLDNLVAMTCTPNAEILGSNVAMAESFGIRAESISIAS